MTKFFNSSVGKATRALLYVFVSTGLTALVAAIQANPSIVGGVMFSGVAIGAVNFALVFVKGLRDPNTPNFPQ